MKTIHKTSILRQENMCSSYLIKCSFLCLSLLVCCVYFCVNSYDLPIAKYVYQAIHNISIRKIFIPTRHIPNT